LLRNPPATQEQRNPPAHGFSVMEMLVALSVLGVLLTTLGQMAVMVAAQQRRSEAQRETAQEANNLMERLTALPFVDLSEESDKVRELADATGNVEFEVLLQDTTEEQPGLRGKSLIVAAKHRGVEGVRCELVAWKHALGDQP